MKDSVKNYYLKTIMFKRLPKWKIFLMKIFNKKAYNEYMEILELKNLEYTKFNACMKRYYVDFLKD